MNGTKTITLKVPEEIYYIISDQATADTRKAGKKKSIHDKMIEILSKTKKATSKTSK